MHPPSGSVRSFRLIDPRIAEPVAVSLDVTLCDTDDVRSQSFLANHPFLCPNLTSIVINVGGYGEVSCTTIEVFSRAITQHEHLDCLDISIPIDAAALTHIAMSSKLKKLTLVLRPDKPRLHQVCIPSDTTPFRNVEELSLEVSDVYFVTPLLRSQDQVFHSFVLSHRFQPTTTAVFALLTALASRQRTRSLRSISLVPSLLGMGWHHFTPAEYELAMGYHLTHDTFRPLASLCHLCELVVDLGWWFSIDDDDLLSLARNWPLLQVLYLSCEQRIDGHIWRSAKYVTFKGLLSLLECCPDLHELCLPLDAREVPVNTGGIICNPALTHIRFVNSPISDPVSVADILVRHFPSVTKVLSMFILPRDLEEVLVTYYASWIEVNTLLQDIHFPDHDDPDL